MFRLQNRSLFPQRLTIGEWFQVELELLGEYNHFCGSIQGPAFQLAAGQYLGLECSLLPTWTAMERDGSRDQDRGQEQDLTRHNLIVQARGLQPSNWSSWASLDVPGIGSSGQGGLEFMVTCSNSFFPPLPATVYVQIDAIKPTSRVIPLVLSLKLWPPSKNWEGSSPIHIYRPFSFPNVTLALRAQERVLLVKEDHSSVMSTSRIWDPAYVVMDVLKKKLLDGIRLGQCPVFAGKHILDLSSGTGILGLYVAGLAQVEMEAAAARDVGDLSFSTSSSSTCSLPLSSWCDSTSSPTALSPVSSPASPASSSPASSPPSSPPAPATSTLITLTDLEDATKLIEENVASNHERIAPGVASMEVKVLPWGNKKYLEALGEVDVVVASDIIYLEESLDDLFETLVGLCTPRRTRIFLGYKRRAMSIQAEEKFFDQVERVFEVKRSEHEFGVRIFELSRE